MAELYNNPAKCEAENTEAVELTNDDRRLAPTRA